jgi:phosphoribosyl-ATP pyrophosphohydrolase
MIEITDNKDSKLLSEMKDLLFHKQVEFLTKFYFQKFFKKNLKFSKS